MKLSRIFKRTIATACGLAAVSASAAAGLHFHAPEALSNGLQAAIARMYAAPAVGTGDLSDPLVLTLSALALMAVIVKRGSAG